MLLPVGEPFKITMASCTNVSAWFSNAEHNADLNPACDYIKGEKG